MDKQEEILLNNEYEDVIYLTGCDYSEALIGVSTDNQAIYDYDKMVECLSAQDGMTYEEAADYISYNTIRALPYMGEDHPIIMNKLEK